MLEAQAALTSGLFLKGGKMLDRMREQSLRYFLFSSLFLFFFSFLLSFPQLLLLQFDFVLTFWKE